MSRSSASAAQPQHQPRLAASPAAPRAPLWNLREVSFIVADLQRRVPWIYWTDFMLSVSAAWALTAVFLLAPAWSVGQILALLGASILFFRAGTFIHEIVHFSKGEMPWFGRIWNLLMGIPLLMPWILYRNHIEHHSVRDFGTPEDGEYLPLAAAPLRETLKYLLQAPLLPLLLVIRFGILAPLSWLHRGLREWTLTAASAGVTNPFYRRRFAREDEPHLRIVETLCLAYLLVIGVLLATRVVSGSVVLRAYLLLAFTMSLNWVRNLAAHGYANHGERMSHTEQFSDSINITGRTWLTLLLFPVGLRYHALHHLLPMLPYHSLGEAHRRLSQSLPPGSPYHAASHDSFFAAAGKLWRTARETADADSAMHRWRHRSRTS